MKLKRFIFLNCLLLLCGSSHVYSQGIPLTKLHIRHFGTREGLLFSPVLCFLQDSRNYMWMGGRALQRYDGYRFKNYFDGREQLLVQCLYEDQQQNIWAGTDKGVYRLNKKTDKFDLFQDSILLNGRKMPMNIATIIDDGGGTLWFGALKFYAVLNASAGKIEDASPHIGFDKRGNGGIITKDAEGNLWFKFPKPYGLARYNWRTKTTSSHYNNPANEPIFNINAGNAAVLPDRNGNIWFSESWDDRTLFRYNTNTNIKYKYHLYYPGDMNKKDPAVPGKLLVDSHGSVWIKLEERIGVARYNAITDSFEYLYADNESKNGLHDVYSITNGSGSLYEDKQGNFWQGGSEVNFFSPYKQVFQTFRLSDYNTTTHRLAARNNNNTPINSFVLMPGNKIVAAFYGDGLWQFSQELIPEQKIQLPATVSPLLWHIFSPDNRHIFISDQSRKISVLDTRRGTTEIKHYKEFPPGFINTSLADNDSTVWIGQWTEAVSRFNPITGQYTNFKSSFTTDPAARITVLSLVRNDATHIWAGASNGLHLFDTKTGKTILSWRPDNTATNGGANLIRHINLLNNDTLLLCSDNGFILYNSRSNTARILTIKDGMPDNICYSSLTEKNRQYVWINTASKGLCRLHIPTLSITSFQDNDGMEIPYGSEASFSAPDGRFVFANNNGFIIFNPVLAHQEPAISRPVITEVFVNGENKDFSELPDKRIDLRLKPWQNTVTVSFSTLDFFNLVNQTYSVQLKGVDIGWVNIGRRSQIEYRNLSPGKYTLLLKSNGEATTVTTEATYFSFVIYPPFWKQWWFFAIVAALLVLAGYFLYRYRIKIVRKQAMMKAEYSRMVNESEIKALRSQMNPHFIFNSLNAINRYILKKEKKEASEYLSKFSKLIRLILDNSRQARIPLAKELKAVELYLELEKLRFQHHFIHEIRIDENISTESVFIPPMIIQPIVENAIWHGLLPKGEGSVLKIQLVPDDRFITCIIEDNGIGRKKAAELKQQQVLEKSSLGISATAQRLQLIYGEHNTLNLLSITDLYDTDGAAAGTRVIIKIPYYLKP